ncbi:MAG: aminotransferase class I/II-fold pyridoxal phosphate-dependent enzyme [Acidimicrobiia bacterium]
MGSDGTGNDAEPVIGFFDRATRDVKTVAQRDFLRTAAAIGQQLAAQGLGPGRWALIVGGSPEAQLLAYFGCVWIGAVPAVHPARPTSVGKRRAEAVQAALDALPDATVLVMEASASGPPSLDGVTASVVHYTLDDERWASSAPGAPHQADPDAIVHVQLSSGTTRAGRAVGITHRNVVENFRSVREPWDLRPTMRALSWLPLGHDLGLIGGVLLPLLAGGDIFLLSPFDMLADPLNWIGTISALGITFSPSPNFGFDQAVRRIDPAVLRTLDLGSWTCAPCGGEPVQDATLRRFSEVFTVAGIGPNVLTPSYGLAEITLCATAGRFTEPTGKQRLADLVDPTDGPSVGERPRHIELVACGRPAANVSVRLIDQQTAAPISSEGIVGEVVVSGPSLAAGYLGKDGVAVPFPNGEFVTGDIGVFRDGVLYIVDRVNNVIIRNAENIPASQIENQIADAVGVSNADVMVVELDIVTGTPRLVAVIELAKSGDPAAAVDALVDSRHDIDLAMDEIYFVGRGVLPTTTSGKKQHGVLKALLANGDLKYRFRFDPSGMRTLGNLDAATSPATSKVPAPEHPAFAILRELCRGQGTHDLVTADAHLFHELALNSLDLFELAVALEDQLSIALDDATVASLRTVADVVAVCTTATTIDLTDDASSRRTRSLLDRLPQINLVVDEQIGRRVRHEGRWLVDFASCNYLGLDLHPAVIAAVAPALQQWGVHPSWTRAVASPRPYVELEQRLADLIGAPDTLVFPTVTLLHMGVLPRLTGSGGTLLVDAEAHNSIQEAALLTRARGAHVVVFPHDDLSALEAELAQSRVGTRVIAIDGVYSMSGESPDLRRYQTLAERYDAIVYVDDAHGIGVIGSAPSESAPYGRGGGGAVRNQGVSYDRLVYVGGMSKAFSSMAAFISCATPAERDLYRMSSSLVFSGPIPVASLASGIAALDVNVREGDALRAELYRLTKRLIDGIHTIGLVTDSDTYFPIVNVPLGSGSNVASACDVLWRHGIIVTPSVFPAAPLGRGGVRFSITAANTDADVDKALDALDEVAGILRGSADLIDLADQAERSAVQDLAR